MVLTRSLYAKAKKGEPAPDFSLKGIDGRVYDLNSYRGRKKAILVVFMCNHCPYVKHKISAIVALDRQFKKKGLLVIGINSNDPSQHPEDSVDGMKIFAENRGIVFPYLVDEAQDVARAYGASCTPDPFLLDGQLRLVYHGRIDDAIEPRTTPTTAEMRRAIEQLIAGEEVSVEEKPSIGCSIKWRR
ncbi:MAG: thioredoxin family protein [Candidatus Aenigmarchaeota archaeon]|nr:thioredoxin family protein [Candidatus Aenigmarchaeota archaeon]